MLVNKQNKLYILTISLTLQVVVRLEDKSYFIFRRYNEFNALQEKIKKKFPEVSLKLPGKRIFLNNFDPRFIKQRREGLHDFILNLVKVSGWSQNMKFAKIHILKNKVFEFICCYGNRCYIQQQ